MLLATAQASNLKLSSTDDSGPGTLRARIQEANLTPDSLAERLKAWLLERPVLQSRAEKARALAMPDSLDRITAECLAAAGVIA